MIELALVFTTGVCITLGYTTWNLLKKYEHLEEQSTNKDKYISDISEAINMSNVKLQEIDAKGTFKGDDEIGWFFKNIMYIQEVLNNYNLNEKTNPTISSNDSTNNPRGN